MITENKKSALKLFRADLHIHTCLSPCGDWDMTPRSVVEISQKRNLDIIAICDHNCAGNVKAAMNAAKQTGVTVIPGMEICSSEEVHLIALFSSEAKALQMQEYVLNNLPGENNPELFGYQVVANEMDEVLEQSDRLLIGAVSVSLKRLVEKIHELEGIAIAAHIDKSAFSILAQLGFIPPDLLLDGVEVSFLERPETAGEKFLYGSTLPCITSSDAHFPHEIGRVTTKFFIAEPTLEEMKLALLGQNGRKLIYSTQQIND